MDTKTKMTEGEKLVSRQEFRNVPESVKSALKDFIDSIPKMELLHPDDNPNKEWDVSFSSTWNRARGVAEYLSKHNADSTIGSYATNDSKLMDQANVILSAGRIDALDLSEASAKNMVLNAMLNLSKNNTEEFRQFHPFNISDVIDDLINDTKLYVADILSRDLNLPGKEDLTRRAESRMNAWRKGYGVVNSENGKLYVYAIVGNGVPLRK